MNAVSSATVRVTEFGAARATGLGQHDDGPLGLTPVALAGSVTVWVDPLRPESVLRIDAFPLDDDTFAVLELLVGAPLATALVDAAASTVTGDPVDEVTVDVALDPQFWPLVTALGFLLWLEEYATAPLSQGDLDLEIAVLAGRLSPLGTGDLATERLERSALHLVDRVEASPDGLAPLLVDALGVAVHGYLDDLGEARVAELASLTVSATELLRVSDDVLTLLRQPSPSTSRVLAAVADVVEPAPEAPRSFSVDWRLVPRNALDTTEGTVTARWTDGARLEITALAAPRGREAHTLMAGVRPSDGTDYRVSGPLSLVEGAYTGSIPLGAPLAGDDVVEVFSVLSSVAPAVGAQRIQLAAVREATRALLAERVPDETGAFSPRSLGAEVATAHWREAADLFAAAGLEGDDARAALCQQRYTDLVFAESDADRDTWRDALPPLAYAETVHLAGSHRS